VSLSAIPPALRVAVQERDRSRCRYCGLRQLGQAATFHVDHVVPRSRGGPTGLANLVLQCPWCSLHKSNKVSGVDPDTGADVPLFHPLENVWPEHFAVNEDATLTGRTPTGRATVAALQMNDPLPRAARALQSMHGLSI
jgi:5-methylcytosine-specific restriction endonuclease McrA